MIKTPEQDKVRALNGLNQEIGSFLDWLINEKKMHFGKYRGSGATISSVLYRVKVDIPELIAEYFGIDLEALEAEKLAVLAELANQQSGWKPDGRDF